MAEPLVCLTLRPYGKWCLWRKYVGSSWRRGERLVPHGTRGRVPILWRENDKGETSQMQTYTTTLLWSIPGSFIFYGFLKNFLQQILKILNSVKGSTLSISTSKVSGSQGLGLSLSITQELRSMFFVFLKEGLHNPGHPETHYKDQCDLRLTEMCLPLFCVYQD